MLKLMHTDQTMVTNGSTGNDIYGFYYILCKITSMGQHTGVNVARHQTNSYKRACVFVFHVITIHIY